jgi:hypothetical protein
MAAGGIKRVEPVGTYARKSGDTVRLQLQLPDAPELQEPTLRLRARNGKGVVEAPAEVRPAGGGVIVTASMPRADLRPGVWRVAVRPEPDGPFRPLRARLLINDRQPIALLSGPVPRTEMAPPRPRTGPTGPTGLRRQDKARRAAVKVVDGALSRLPEERAARYRAALAKAARRVRL